MVFGECRPRLAAGVGRVFAPPCVFDGRARDAAEAGRIQYCPGRIADTEEENAFISDRILGVEGSSQYKSGGGSSQ